MLQAGEVVGDVYRIGDLIGEGGMGQVFEAIDMNLNRRVAVKAAWHSMGPDALRHEARVMAAFRHPGIAAVHAMGIHNGSQYVVMERLFGGTLGAHIDQRLSHGEFAITEVIDILLGACGPLGALHAANLAHRDIKPDNIMLAPPNRVVLLDFGALVQESLAGPSETIAGTPSYIAPEVCTGQSRRGLAFAADIYALGALGFELLTGTPPFVGDSVVQVLSAHIHDAAPDIRSHRNDVPNALADLIGEMLAKDPQARPPSIEAIEVRLRMVQVALTARRVPQQLSVLITEDDDLMQELLVVLVSAALPNATIRCAGNADAALAMFTESPPDVCMLDLEMPGTNGLELAMYLRSTSLADNTSFVVVSGRVGPAERELFNHLRINEFVHKGVALQDELSGVLGRIAQEHHHVSTAAQRLESAGS